MRSLSQKEPGHCDVRVKHEAYDLGEPRSNSLVHTSSGLEKA